MKSLTKRERLQAIIAGEVPDRVAVALWRHWPVDDQDPAILAESIVAFQEAFDFDFVKVTPASSFCLRDWGVEDEWRGNVEGTRDYRRYVIRAPQDWRSLPVLSPEAPNLKAQLRCLELLAETFGDQVPYIQTIFNPLSQAKNLAGEERLFEHLRRDPVSVEAGLETIAQSTIAFVEAAKKTGISGIFYAIQHASYHYFDQAGYSRFGERYDQRVLEAAGDLWLNVLHLHGKDLIFELAGILPAQVVNWHDREAGPSLVKAKELAPGAVCGGIRIWDTMVLAEPEGVRREAKEALNSMQGRGMVLGTGCVVPIIAPRGNILAVRRAVDCA